MYCDKFSCEKPKPLVCKGHSMLPQLFSYLPQGDDEEDTNVEETIPEEPVSNWKKTCVQIHTVTQEGEDVFMLGGRAGCK